MLNLPYFHKFLLTYYLVLSIYPSSLTAVDKQPHWSEEPVFFTVEKLQGRDITAIVQDHSGFLWLGSQGGVHRFDGYELKTFLPDPQNPNALSGPYVSTLAVDQENRIWVGTLRNGISIYDPKSGQFFKLRRDVKSPNGLPSDNINKILIDDSNRIWIATKKGLCIADPKTLNLTTIKLSSRQKSSVIKSEAGINTETLYMDRDKNLWIGHQRGLAILRANSQHIEYYPLYDMSNNLWERQIRSIYQTSDGQMWFGTMLEGLGFINRNNKFELLPIHPKDNQALNGKQIDSLLEVNDTLWVGTFTGGISIVDLASKKVLRTIKNSPADKDKGYSMIRQFTRDRSGLLLIGTLGGLQKYDPKASIVTHLKNRPNQKRSLSFNNILAAREQPNGNIWLSYFGNGIDILNPKLERIKSIKPSDRRKNWFRNDILDIAFDQSGNIWLAPYNEGLLRFDEKNNSMFRFQGGLSRANIFVLYPFKNALWIGAEDGIYRLNLSSMKIRNFSKIKDSDQPMNHRVRDIIATSENNIWISTVVGVFVLPDRQDELLALQYDPNKIKSLQIKNPGQIILDSSGDVWVQDKVKGVARLSKWDGVNSEFEFFNHTMQTLLSDDYGNLWSRNNHFNTQTLKLTPLTPLDGLTIKNSWNRSSTKIKDGRLLFASIDGLFAFDPKEFTRWNYNPPIVSTYSEIGGQEKILDPLQPLTLTPDQNEFMLKFSALDFSDPGKIKYRYRLDGYQKNWTNASSELRSAKFMNLPPGDYQFTLQGTNRLGDWSKLVYSIPVSQQPAWYQTALFKITLIISSILFVYLILEYRTYILRQRTIVLENLVDEKTRDIKNILQVIQQGILLIESGDGKVGQEYSTFLKKLSNSEEVTGQDFYQLLFENSSFTSDEKSQIMEVIRASVGQEEIGFLINSHLLPRQVYVRKEGKKLIYELDWNPVVKESIVVKILLVIRDVTELHQLELAAKEQQQELEIIQDIISIPPEDFDNMIATSLRFINENKEIIKEQSEFKLEIAQHLFRNMHTLKGLARSYNLKSLAHVVHEVEQTYAQFIEAKSWQTEVMLTDLNKVQKTVDVYRQTNNETLGREHKDLNQIKMDRQSISEKLRLLKETEEYSLPAEVVNRINNVKLLLTRLIAFPFSQVIRNQIKAAASIARQLEKAEPRITVKDEGFSIDRGAHELLSNVFTHLIRNSIDHGIELPRDRLSKNKPEHGMIQIELRENQSQLDIFYSDDGQGLDLQAIYSKAIKKGIINKSFEYNAESVANLIFDSGLSTTKKVSDISGRGVGMDAVKKFLEDKSCSIKILVDNTQTNGLGYTPAQFVISLTREYYQPFDAL